MLTIRPLCAATVLAASCSLLSAQMVCPPLPNQLSARAAVSTSYDARSRLYTYRYTITNDAISRQQLKYFVVEAAQPVSGIKSPADWVHMRFGPNLVGWLASGEGKAEQHPWGASPAHGQVKPGESQSGFEFRSPNAPGSARMFVRGYSGRYNNAGEAEAESGPDSCPEPAGDFFELAVEGSTTAPVKDGNETTRERATDAAGPRISTVKE